MAGAGCAEVGDKLQEGHSTTQTLGMRGGAQGSWQPHRDQHTNATTTTSPLFPEE